MFLVGAEQVPVASQRTQWSQKEQEAMMDLELTVYWMNVVSLSIGSITFVFMRLNQRRVKQYAAVIATCLPVSSCLVHARRGVGGGVRRYDPHCRG